MRRRMIDEPQFQVWACFEFNAVDAPILRAIKTTLNAIVWRDADNLNRFIVPFTLDAEPPTIDVQAQIEMMT